MKSSASGRVLVASALLAITWPRIGDAQAPAPPNEPSPAASPVPTTAPDGEPPSSDGQPPSSDAPSPVAPQVPPPAPPPAKDGDKQTATERRLAAQAACNARDPSCDWMMTFSSLEKLSIRRTLAELALEIEPAPWGKVIGQIRVYNEDVFAEKNWLRFFNVFHVTTATASIRGELTVGEGQLWDDELIAESARRLKDPLYTGVVALVPTRAADPAQVDLLVVTRDIWSLRLNTQYQIQAGSLTNLSISLSENNFLGRRKTVALSMIIDQAAITAGPLFIDKNFLGQHVDFRFRIDRIFTRRSLDVFQPDGSSMPSGDPGGIQDEGTLHAEGSQATVSLTKTLWSLASKWGGGASFSYRNAINRTYLRTGLRAVDDPSTPTVEFLAREYRMKSWSTRASAVRQWGGALKHQLEAGHSVSNQVPSLLPSFPADPMLREFFIGAVFPRTELISSPFLEYSLFLAKFKTVRNVDTYDLAEDLRLGPNVTVGLQQSLGFLGSDVYFTRPSLVAGWTFPWSRDGFVRLSAGGQVRIQGGETIDNTATGLIRAATPTLGYFRIVGQTHFETRWNDTQNSFYSLGSDSGLRAYNIGQFIGNRRFVGQIEARSVPIPFWVLRLGAAAFYEVGGAADSFSQMQLHQDIGVGFRMLIPQTARDLFRFDFAKPFDNGQSCPLPGNICFIAGFDSYF